MNDDDIVAIGAARTAIGGFGGSARDVAAVDLGATAIRGAIARAGIEGRDIEQVIFANCRQAGNGPNPARTASVRGGVPIDVPAFTVNMACPSGMKTMMLAARELAGGNGRFIVTGGMESMSTMPYLLKNARWEGFRHGDKILSDSWSDTIDPLCGFGMGITAENLVEKYGLGRDEMDAFAAQSHAKAARAQAEGWTECEIVPLNLPSRRGEEVAPLTRDETIRHDTNVDRLGKLKPVFKKDGRVTAGNSCGMGDGACAIVLTTRAHARARGHAPLFSIVASAQAAVEPAVMGEGPGLSIPRALAAAGLALKDINFIEVNEAFAAQMLANERMLGWDRGKVNVFGGAIALGHPTGISGARIVMTLDNILRRHDKELGVAAICGGGGVTTAMVIRRER